MFLLACLIPHGAWGERLSLPELQQQLESLFESSPVTERTTVCLKVVDLSTGQVLFDRGGDRLLTPASNLKVYTAACGAGQIRPPQELCDRAAQPANWTTVPFAGTWSW